ncbi:MAG: hypothetical protein KDD25_06170 [Bdellovibrionales bacterium]|nr:hypothetical protein [Bdellovibrionales bacterium]
MRSRLDHPGLRVFLFFLSLGYSGNALSLDLGSEARDRLYSCYKSVRDVNAPIEEIATPLKIELPSDIELTASEKLFPTQFLTTQLREWLDNKEKGRKSLTPQELVIKRDYLDQLQYAYQCDKDGNPYNPIGQVGVLPKSDSPKGIDELAERYGFVCLPRKNGIQKVSIESVQALAVQLKRANRVVGRSGAVFSFDWYLSQNAVSRSATSLLQSGRFQAASTIDSQRFEVLTRTYAGKVKPDQRNRIFESASCKSLALNDQVREESRARSEQVRASQSRVGLRPLSIIGRRRVGVR